MKKSKTLKRLAAIILAGTMMFAMGTSVSAESGTGKIESVTLTKTVAADANVKAPNTSFTFSVSTAAQEEAGEVITAYAGVSGGLYFKSGNDTIKFTSDDTLFSKTTELSLDKDAFSIPGVYHYKVKETTGSYDGMTYDSKEYDVYVYVENDTDSSNGLKVSAVESKYNGEKKDLLFTNTYKTNTLTLKKVIAGNQGNKNQEFRFTLTITGADGEKYTAVNGNTTAVLTSGTSATYDLGNDETVVIYGLSANDTYTIVENDYSNDGYVTTIDGATETDKLTATGTVDITNGTNVTYTNTKDVSTPTGIITNVLPYVLMVVAAAGLAFVFLRKREYDR